MHPLFSLMLFTIGIPVAALITTVVLVSIDSYKHRSTINRNRE